MIDDTIILICLSFLVIVLFGVLVMFKTTNKKKPTVRSISKEDPINTKIPMSNKKKTKDRKNNQQNLKNRKSNTNNVIQPEPKIEEVREIKKEEEKPVKTIELITENLFEQYYYNSPFDHLEPEPKTGNMEYIVCIF